MITNKLNGRVVIDTTITGMTANPQVAAGRFEPPAAVTAGASRPATGNVPYQWVLRRQFIGTYLDSDSVSFDTQSSAGLRLNELAPGVQHPIPPAPRRPLPPLCHPRKSDTPQV